jgi:hypothetical protein
MIRRFLLIITVLFLAISSNAQVKFGLQGGLNLSNVTEKDKDVTYSKDYKSKPGFNLGVTAEFSKSEKLSFESGLFFSTKGHKVEDTGIKITVNFNYLEVPVNVIYKIDLGSSKVFLKAGPYFGYAVSGKVKANEKIFDDANGNPTDEITIKFGNDKDNDNLKAIDYGLNFGAGVEFNQMTLGFQYGLGLANLALDTSNSYKMSNKVMAVSIGYRFSGN